MSKDESVNVEVDQTVGASNSTTTQTSGGTNMTEGQPLTAQEISQMIAQANDALFSKMSDMLSGLTATQVTEERTYDIGEGEAWKFNMKRMADEYQHESLESIRRNRSYIDNKLSNAEQNDLFKHNVANQALQNAVETANMVAKQAVRHSDIAIDRQWNIDEQAGFVAKVLNSIQDPATSAAMAVAIANAMLKKD
jgi:hypothetical protein